MPDSNPRDAFFNLSLRPIIDSYNTSLFDSAKYTKSWHIVFMYLSFRFVVKKRKSEFRFICDFIWQQGRLQGCIRPRPHPNPHPSYPSNGHIQMNCCRSYFDINSPENWVSKCCRKKLLSGLVATKPSSAKGDDYFIY